MKKKFIVSKNKKIMLNNKQYLLEKGDKIIIEENQQTMSVEEAHTWMGQHPEDWRGRGGASYYKIPPMPVRGRRRHDKETEQYPVVMQGETSGGVTPWLRIYITGSNEAIVSTFLGIEGKWAAMKDWSSGPQNNQSSFAMPIDEAMKIVGENITDFDI